MSAEFLGFERPNGSIGVRNHIAIISSVICANEVSNRVANQVQGVQSITHPFGCAQAGKDLEQIVRTLIGVGTNPNVAGVIVIGLGCETIVASDLADKIAESRNSSVESFTIQDVGGTSRAIEKGVRIAQKMTQDASKLKRKSFDVSELILGTECGGSDFTSGLAANPALGVASDILIKSGGTVFLTETTELIGAEHILAKRAVSNEISRRIVETIKNYEKNAMEMGVDIRGSNPTPGNIAGGLTTIEEKSLGAIHKTGSSPIMGVLEYAQKPDRDKHGLYFMDTPGFDIESVTGQLAGGSQIVCFTTGRGSTTGSPIAPVIKIVGNPRTYEKMKENFDINAGTIIEGKETIEEVGQRIWNEILEVASGKFTKTETFGFHEFAIWRAPLSVTL